MTKDESISRISEIIGKAGQAHDGDLRGTIDAALADLAKLEDATLVEYHCVLTFFVSVIQEELYGTEPQLVTEH